MLPASRVMGWHMAKQLGFLIDLGKCVGCRGCEMACISENKLEQFYYRKVTNVSRPESQFYGFFSIACNHCINPECIRVCKDRCYRKRRDGIVLHDASRCSGCRSCVGACPFRAPAINPKTGKVGKCSFCFNRIDNRLQPACVSACITGALAIVDMNGPLPEGAVKNLPEIPIVHFTKPSVRFIPPTPPLCFWRSI